MFFLNFKSKQVSIDIYAFVQSYRGQYYYLTISLLLNCLYSLYIVVRL